MFDASLIISRVCLPTESARFRGVFWFFTKFKKVTSAAVDATKIAIAISFSVTVVLASMAMGKVLPRMRFLDFNFDVAKRSFQDAGDSTTLHNIYVSLAVSESIF